MRLFFRLLFHSRCLIKPRVLQTICDRKDALLQGLIKRSVMHFIIEQTSIEEEFGKITSFILLSSLLMH